MGFSFIVRIIAHMFSIPVVACSGLPDNTFYVWGMDAKGEVLVKQSSFEEDLTGQHFKEFVEEGKVPVNIRVADNEPNLKKLWELYGHQGNVTRKNYQEKKECKDVAGIIKEILDESEKL